MAEVDRTNRGRRLAAEAANNRRRKKRRRGKRTLHYILLTIFFLATGAVLSLTVLFKIDSVTVIGADKYPPDEIVAASGINIGDNLFRFDSLQVRDNLLKQFPYIETANVHLKLPHGVQIEITQCTPSGALQDGDEFAMITREGKVLEKGLILIPENIPLIVGVDTEGAKAGEMLGDNARDAMTMLNYLFNAAKETNFGEITNVDLTDIYNMKIIYEDRLLLNLGTEAELSEKLDFVKEMIDNRLPKDAQGMINASNISRSLIYTEMPIEDAKIGKKRSEKKPAAQSQPDEDKPRDESSTPAKSTESSQESKSKL